MSNPPYPKQTHAHTHTPLYPPLQTSGEAEPDAAQERLWALVCVNLDLLVFVYVCVQLKSDKELCVTVCVHGRNTEEREREKREREES